MDNPAQARGGLPVGLLPVASVFQWKNTKDRNQPEAVARKSSRDNYKKGS
jgi:hypothetical protein